MSLDLSFEIIDKENSASYSDGCSGGRSDCCTRVCTRNGIVNANQDSSLQSWEDYLEINAGVLQY